VYACKDIMHIDPKHTHSGVLGRQIDALEQFHRCHKTRVEAYLETLLEITQDRDLGRYRTPDHDLYLETLDQTGVGFLRTLYFLGAAPT